MQTTIPLTREALYILFKLKQAGYEAYLVGGAVRDLLLGKNPYEFDLDFTTNAIPEQIAVIFPNSFYENKFGTVSITSEHLLDKMQVSQQYREALISLFKPTTNRPTNKVIDLAKATKVHTSLSDQTSVREEGKTASLLPNFEITTYRSKEIYAAGTRKPQSLEWGTNINEDLKRRDFTINAIALSLPLETLRSLLHELETKDSLLAQLNFDQLEITADPDALTDLDNNLIKCVGEPQERFVEDALRMLRAVRLAVQLDMQIDIETLSAIKATNHFIKEVSFERVRDEFLKMLGSKHPKQAIMLLDDTGLLQYILGELLAAKGVNQGGHHTTDVWTHSLDALAACPSPDPIVRLATLLHDIAKPPTYKIIDGQPTFYNHEVIGARIARDIGRRLRLSKEQIDRLFILVRFHMFHYQVHNTDAAIRRLMRKVGLQNLDDILDLREGDRLGSGAHKTSWRLEEMKERMIAQLNQPLSTHDLAIDGHDLMAEFDLKPGPKIGQLLNTILEKVLEDPSLNTKPALMELTKTLL